MCGIVGLFVGCAALAYCPRQLSAEASVDPAPAGSPPADSSGTGDYRSPFGSWYERSSVRAAPRREVEVRPGADRFFSPELVPVAGHPLVAALPPERFDRLLLHHLYRYLDFTEKLETLVVNRTAVGIAQGSVGVTVPEAMRFDAYKIYCDEAYHALFSADLARQAHRVSGVAPVLPAEPYFLRRLRALIEDGNQDIAPLVELLFVIVSETLISASLSEVPDDPKVVPAVRESIRDHALDEGRHHAYFAAFLRHLWAELDPAERHRAALLVPDLVHAFLQPDRAAMHAELGRHGLTGDQARQVVAETLTDEVVNSHTAATARLTLRHLAALDAFRTSEVQERFFRAGIPLNMERDT
ncbi:diiron oxygenase [Kitasatospora fiedleri]|uniref:diiron oxygenase n=1 Tax=Kitasatospora fiedleri TaxID=2991545 RepID=UPI00249CB8DA|nr:diiron oxygenase [Kitasatospora fiedleri]